MTTCPACGTPAREVYPFGHKWAAHPCGCVIPPEQAAHLRTTLARQAGTGRLRGLDATLTRRAPQDVYADAPPRGRQGGAESS